MNLKERLIDYMQPLFLALFAVWGLVVANALVAPIHHERTGSVEVYSVNSLTPAAH